ncbi:MAG: methionyl-tRNA formyltransferase, partial [Bdellovibrionaceae bacterium]|nr:methionyl-tRNA formyltransferase [Pseudobdellovibrionaceae bacterium]
TQPDRPAGLKMPLTPSPVKLYAITHNIPVVAPESLKKNPLLQQEILKWKAEVGVVVAFGQILDESFMNKFQFGCVNVHASILPRWRGAAPIQRALEAGDRETGVTLQKMVQKLDAGDIIGIRRVDVPPEMDAAELHDRLAFLGADLLRVELMDFIRGNLAPIPQNEAEVTYAKKIDKSEARLDWHKPAELLHNKVRAFVLGPGCWCLLDGKKIKIYKTLVVEGSGSPGQILKTDEQGITVACGDKALRILELQPESRNRMPAAEFIKGYPLQGVILQ